MSSPLNLIQIQNASKSFGPKHLFHEASFAINESEHVGVIGPNGAGKSTLFKVLIEQDHLDEGVVIRAQKLSVGYLSQHDHWSPTETGNEYLARTTKIPLWELKSQGRELQVSEEILDKTIVSLSGGYRMRIKLLALLGQSPNLMLLDEPTNYLDLETTLLLEKFLQNYEGAFLLISHDREFLRRTTDHILEIEAGDMTKYNGNIDDYFEQKEMLREQLESRAQSLADKKKTIMDFVNRFGAKATKARQAQSKLKSLQKMESIDLKPLPISANIKIPSPTHTGKAVLQVSHSDFGYGEKVILQNVSMQINRGDHVAVVGLNGAGKSTLLKGISGTMSPLKGQCELGFGVKVAFFNQHVVETLQRTDTVYDSLAAAAHAEVTRQDILDMAGSLLFSGDDIHKKISVLSGGECSRVALGRVLLQKTPCLILDEPTNHLDFQTVEALTVALQKYDGTVIVVSHDRGFIRRIGTKILEVASGRVHLYPGSYDDYVWKLQNDLAREGELAVTAEHKEQKSVSQSTGLMPFANSREQKKELEKQQRSLEKKVQAAEDQIASLQRSNELLNQKIIENAQREDIEQLSQNTLKIEELENLWMTTAEELHQVQARLTEIKN